MWLRHPSFASLSQWLVDDALPSPARLNAWLDAPVVDGADARRRTARGALVHFVEAEAARRGALAYETGILATGAVPLRPGNWHDAFNALAWIAWPAFKREVNALHVTSAQAPAAPDASRRGARRDALTLLDESGVIVLCADPALAALLRERRWRELFHDRHDVIARALRFLICGHALFDKLRAPYRSITGRALIVPVTADSIALDIDAQRAVADAAVARMLSGVDTTSSTVPLPLAGIPGWWPGNECATFYDDAAIFRPAHASTASASPATASQSACAPAPFNSSAEP